MMLDNFFHGGEEDEYKYEIGVGTGDVIFNEGLKIEAWENVPEVL